MTNDAARDPIDVARRPPLRVAGLFAGIGGIELGLHRAGHQTVQLCEIDLAARAVLTARFLDPASSHFAPALENASIDSDVADIEFADGVQLVAAGFPCTDLSQVGRTAGIGGKNSGLIQHLFAHLDAQANRLGNLEWLLLENVPFMLQLDRGAGMRYLVEHLEARGFRWAYRVVDSQAFGLPQRRQRVIVLASRTEDPREVLLVDDQAPIKRLRRPDTAIGFYWTEGNRGLGWAIDAVPTLKGGSALGIASPPAVWLPDGRIVTPTIEVAERLQGFPRGWTASAQGVSHARNARWKLVGNAVTVPMAAWVGSRLRAPGQYVGGEDDELVDVGLHPWPRAAWGGGGKVYRAQVGTWPLRRPYREGLVRFMRDQCAPLSERATIGFLLRLLDSGLSQRHDEAFVGALAAHYLGQSGDPKRLPERLRGLSATRPDA